MLRTISCFVSLVISVCMFSYQSFGQLPTATLGGGDQTICANTPVTVIVTLTGSAPWTFTYIDPSLQSSDNRNVITITSSPYALKIYPKFNETISAYSVSNLVGVGTASGSINVTVTPNLSPVTIPAQIQAGPVISGPNPINCSLGQTLITADAGHNYYQWFLYNIKYHFFEALSGEIGQVVNATTYGAGSYMVRMIDANCTSYSSIAAPITLTDPFTKPVITGSNTFQCGSPNTILTATAGFVKYEWILNGNIIQSGASNTIVANTFGAGTYTVKVYNQSNCNNTSPGFAITETYPFNAPVISPSVAMRRIVRCTGGQNTLTAPAGFSLYQWKRNDVIVKSGTDNTLDLNQSAYGNGAYTITVYDAQGCKNSSAYYTLVNMVPPGTAPVLTASPNMINCNGIPSLIQTSPTDDLYQSYLWSDGSTNSTLSVTKAGTYTVTVKDVSGCTNTGTITLTDAPLQNVVISSTTVTRVCQTGSTIPTVTLQSSVSPAGFNKSWYKDGVYVTNTPTLTVQSSGVYSLKLMPNTANPTVCYPTSNALPIQITAPPLPYAAAKFVCGSAATYTHTANGAGSNQVYKWYADQTGTTPLYVSTGFADAGYVSTYASIFVSIYDQLSGCETSRTNLFYSVDPLKLPDQTVEVCDDGTATINITTDAVAGGGYYSIAGLGVFTSNVIAIPRPTVSKVYKMSFTSVRGCKTTTDATITFSALEPDISIVSYDPSITNPLCAGNSVLLKVNNPEATHWVWYDSPTSTTALWYSNPPGVETWPFQVTVSGNKTYYVVIWKGECKSARKAVNVNAVANPSADFIVKTYCNQQGEAQYSGTFIPQSTFTWDYDGGILDNYGLITWATGGNKAITLTVNSQGCIAKKTIYAAVYPAPQALNFSLPASACQSAMIPLYDGIPSGGTYSHSSLDENKRRFTSFSGVGTQYLTYQYKNGDGCIYEKTKSINILPAPQVSMSAVSAYYCQSSVGVALTGTPAGGSFTDYYTYLPNNIFIPSEKGNHTIQYNYTDPVNGCSNVAYRFTTVLVKPFARFDVKNQCDQTALVTYTGGSTGNLAFVWNFDGATILSADPGNRGPFTIRWDTQGTKNISLQITNEACSHREEESFTATPLLKPELSITSSLANPICGQGITYNVTLTDVPASRTIQWKRNGLIIAGATNTSYTSAAIGNGDKITCEASFTDLCTYKSVVYSSNVYEQTVVSTINYLKLDGTDDKVTIPANAAYDLGSGDFTMEAFVIVDVRTTVPTPILSKRTTATNGFVLYLNDNTLTLKIGSTVYNSSTFTSIKDQYLHQVGVSRQNGMITFYLDGRTIGTASSTFSINSTANLLLGNDAVDASYMRGYIQNVNFSSLANDFSSTTGLQISPRSSTGIIGSWFMTGCSGQSFVKDYSTVSNNAYLGDVLGAESSDPVYSNPPKVILYTPNAVMNSLSFVSGTNNSKHVEIPNNGAYGAFNSNFTIEAFVQGANANVNSYPTILSKRSASSNGFAIGINNGKVFVSIGSNIFYDNGSYNLNNSGCNHIVLTSMRVLGKSMFYVFVNGVQTYSFSMSGYFNTSDPIWIGNDRGTPNVFNASIDEIRIWNSTRLPDQISSNRNSVFNSSTPNLIGYYRFKENINSQVVLDESSLGNPGFLGNSTALDINDPIREVINCYANSRVASPEETITPDQFETTEAQAPSILLYPNPFGTNCKLQIQHLDADVTIHIMDAAGNIVFVKENHPAGEELVFGDELPQGMYILQCIGHPELKPVKFIKMK